MRSDRDIRRAMEWGERNQRSAELIRNWCAHVRIARMGGRGLVEDMTGLPIGHATLECEFAETPGPWMTANWDEAAVQFYDRHCATCPHREPVGFPNISQLVARRDKARSRRAEAERKREDDAADRLAARRRERSALREKISGLGGTVVDQLDELDSTHSADVGVTIAKMAELASDAFDEELVEYLFTLLERDEDWATAAALETLDHLGAQRPRLVRAAMTALARHSARDIAASLVEQDAALATPDLVDGALPALIQMAQPMRGPFQYDRIIVRGPLISLYRALPAPVEIGIGRLLGSRSRYQIETGARGISALSREAPDLPARFARDLTAVLARAEHLIDDPDSDDDDKLIETRDALALAWKTASEQADTLFDAYFDSAAESGQARMADMLGRALATEAESGDSSLPGVTVLLRRILGIATTSASSDVLRQIHYALGGRRADGVPTQAVTSRSFLARRQCWTGKPTSFGRHP